jgi:hypothetical protein
LGETVDLLEPCTSNATLEDTVILFCVHVERLVVDRWARLECMGRWGWVLGKGGLGIAVRRGGWLVIGGWRGTVIEVVEVRRCLVVVVSVGPGRMGQRVGRTVELVLDNGV